MAGTADNRITQLLGGCNSDKIQTAGSYKLLDKKIGGKTFDSTQTDVDRAGIYKNIKKIINKIDSDKCLITNNNIISMDNTVFLKKKIGTKSKYGMAFLMETKQGEYKLASKIMENDHHAESEIEILKEIQKKATENMHLPVTYNPIYCNPREENIIWDPFAKKIKRDKYIILFNEIANGDLKQFLKYKKHQTEKIMKNTLAQIYMSLFTFHSLGFVHRDSHWGNFLYHANKQLTGCVHYKVNGKNLYIPNMGRTWVIWDFGLSKKASEYKKNTSDTTELKMKYISDFKRIAHAFIPKQAGGWLTSKQTLENYAVFSKLTSDFSNMMVTNPLKIIDICISFDIFQTSPIGKITNKKPIVIDVYRDI
jgi:serine/threonine protein kinase